MSAGTAKDGVLPWPDVLRSGCTTHHLAVGHEARAVAAALAAGVQRVFFQFGSKIFAELIENTENFY